MGESGEFVKSMIKLEQSIANNEEQSEDSAPQWTGRRAKSVNPKYLEPNDTQINEESDFEDECVVISSPDKRHKTLKPGKRRYGKSRRHKTIPKLTENPYEGTNL